MDEQPSKDQFERALKWSITAYDQVLVQRDEWKNRAEAAEKNFNFSIFYSFIMGAIISSLIWLLIFK